MSSDLKALLHNINAHHIIPAYNDQQPKSHSSIEPISAMSFLGFGGGRPQPTSEQKIQAAEAEIEMVSNMFNQYFFPLPFPC